MEILQIENLNFKYPNRTENTLNKINLDVFEGDFVLLCGATGCGKTTFLKMLKKELSPVGELSGNVLVAGNEEYNPCDVGFVMQNPDNQIVTDKVWHELAFALENMGIPTPVIRRRVSEMASFFGIGDWFYKSTEQLSGGQKQILNLASVMVMQPKLLILDEPTTQLDPIAAADFTSMLIKLNRELGLTIIIAEHQSEELFPFATKVLVMDKGELIINENSRIAATKIDKLSHIYPALPASVRIFRELGGVEGCPLTVKEGRDYLSSHFKNTQNSTYYDKNRQESTNTTTINVSDVWFKYEKNTPDVLRGMTLTVGKGEILCILGENGSGKTTALRAISGMESPYRGKISVSGAMAFLPQEVLSVFLKDTVREDLEDVFLAKKTKCDQEALLKIADKLKITHLLSYHPYDLSGGEQQKCALAKLLLLNPSILLLDEPTKGIDAFTKIQLRKILQDLTTEGITIVIVTHDISFAAETADKCAMFFNGEITSMDKPHAFFSENTFYTTAANRISRHLISGAITVDEVTEAFCESN